MWRAHRALPSRQPLAARVDIDEYAEKIVRHAERFEAWSGEQLTGLVATYCNDPGRQAAFVTSVSVLPARQGEGIASRLLQACTESVRQTGFKAIELEVGAHNTAATRLYEKHGFAVSHTRNNAHTTIEAKVRRCAWLVARST